MFKNVSLVLLMTFAATQGVLAEGDTPKKRDHKVEANKACVGKSAGDSCSYERNGKTVNGTCKKIDPAQAKLVCQPM